MKLTESINDVRLYTHTNFFNSFTFTQYCIMIGPKSRWYSFLDDLRGIPRSVNELNFYFPRHFLMSPSLPPVLSPRCLDYTAERRQIGRISSPRNPFTREYAFTCYRYEESVNARECVYCRSAAHAGPGFYTCGPTGVTV